jgi:hypothetical protein
VVIVGCLRQTGEVDLMDPNVWAVLAGVLVIVGLSDRLMLRAMRGEFRATHAEINRVEEKIDGVEKRLDEKIDAQVGGLNEKIDTQIGGLNEKIDTQVGGLAAVVDARLKAVEGDMSLVKAHLLGVHRASEDSRAGA